MGAGMIEGLLVVTPTETIKTKLIHDANLPQPTYKGMVHGVTTIARTEGLRGLYRGVFPVLARQGCNQATRFSVYTFLRQSFAPTPGTPISPLASFGMGMIAGTITVYVTMPIDVVKTKMQGVGAQLKYPKGSWQCVMLTFKEDGLRGFWKGATPRLSRLMFSGGIVFSVYEQIMQWLK
jgi:solute carrier family 25 citrate transporter 1